jgi:hypothetical protein
MQPELRRDRKKLTLQIGLVGAAGVYTFHKLENLFFNWVGTPSFLMDDLPPKVITKPCLIVQSCALPHCA